MVTKAKNKADKLAETAKNRSNIYELLARLFRCEVTPDFLALLKDPQFLGVLSSMDIDFGDELDKGSEAEIIENLEVEFTRLFLGPDKHISAHESLHHERNDGDWGSFWGASTVEVKKFIETAGLKYREEFKEMPDHISVELEFMQLVTKKEAEILEDPKKEGLHYCMSMQKKFITEHLIKWIPVFCDKVIQQAEMAFYKEIARLTKDFIEYENKNIDKYISDAKG